MSYFHLRQASLVSLVAWGLLGCSGGALDNSDEFNMGGSGGNPPVNSDYCDARPILETSCEGRACHGDPGGDAFAMNFNNPPDGMTIGESLLDREAENYDLASDSDACPTDDPELIINSSNPDESLMLKKVLGTHACGDKMPPGSSVPQEDIDCLRDWITGVAANASAAQ